MSLALKKQTCREDFLNILFQQVQQFCEQHNLLPGNAKIIIGLSGGPDSTFLLHYLHHAARTKNLHLIAAHLDHQWRAESASDVEFCRQLCEQLQVPFVHSTITDLGIEKRYHGSQEAFGRTARRFFFEQLIKAEQADFIALAHHAGDQQETFFIRLLRGTTLTGLAGMRPSNGLYIRPLLEMYKRDIVQCLQDNNIKYLIDPSNESMQYLRNRIRAQALPALRSCDERFDQNFANTLHSLRESEDFLHQLTQYSLTECTTQDGALDFNLWQVQPRYMQQRILVLWLYLHKVPFTLTNSVLDEIVRFMGNSKNKQHRMHETWILIKKNNYLLVEKIRTSD